MGSSGKGSTTTTGSPSPYAQSDLNSIMSLARQDQKLPFQGTQLQTAPINQQQYQGIGGVNNYANYAQPGISTAANWINQAAQPISANQINQYMSPYTQDVINATQAQFNNQNQQQMQGVKGNAISQGALGGNREAIAEAETANQQQLAQAPVIAGLENQGYQTGLNTALTEQQNLANSAYGLTNVATAGQNAGLTGANAQIGAGTLEQQNQQQAYGNLWNYQQAQAAYPWQQLAALAPVYTGVASAEGGTTVGTPPAPSAISQAAGAGTLATGLFGSTGAVPYMNSSSPASAPTTAYRGGAIRGYDSGGGVEDYIPIPKVATGTGIPKPAPSASGSGSGKGSLSGVGNIAGGSGIMGGLGNAFNAGMSSFGEAFPEAGAAIADALPLLALRRGGHVHGYDDGGAVLPSPYSTQSNGISPTPYGGHNSYIPQIQVPRGQGIPKASQPHQDNMQQQMQQIKSLTDGLMGKPSNDPTPIASGTTAPPPPSAELEDSEHDPEYAQWRGGGIHGYADGGSPPNKEVDDPIDTLWNYGNPVPSDGSAGILPSPDKHWTNDTPASGVIGQKGDIITQPRSPYIDTISSSQYNPDDLPNPYLDDIAPVDHDIPLPPPKTNLNHPPPNDGSGEYVNLPPTSQPTSGISAYTPPDKTAKPSGFFSGINLSKDSKLWPSLISAGLGMMASRSPYAAVGIGEGGQQGLNTYQKLDTQERTEKLKQSEIDNRAKQLSLEADKFNKQYTDLTAYQRATLENGKIPPGYRKVPGGNLMEPIPGGPSDPTVLSAVEKAKAEGKSASSQMSPETKEVMARQMIDGNFTGYNSLGRTAQGLAVRNELNNMATEIAMRENGLTPAQASKYLNDRKQEFGARQIGLNTEARTAGQRETNLNLILKTAESAIPSALEASDQVERYAGKFVPLNQIIQKGEIMTSNKELARFGMANLQLAEFWARAMNPTGVMRESDRDKALSFLSTATSKETYAAMVDQLHNQIIRERDSIRKVDPNAPISSNQISTPTPGSHDSPLEGERRQFKQGWGVYHNGQWVSEKQ